jgi:ATP-dependent protease ClpP protease subunit
MHITANTFAAEFLNGPKGIGIEIIGEIEKGDAAKLANFLLKDGNMRAFLSIVFLDSPGGDVQEALKLSEILDVGFTQTVVSKDATCASACVYLWAAGSVRHVAGQLGLHRLTTATPSLDIRKTEKATQKPANVVDSYLTKMGMPRKILEKMNETSSSDIFIVDTTWLANEDLLNAVSYRPTFVDVSTRFCGADPFIRALARGKKVDSSAAMEWSMCIDDVRVKNQEINYKNILSTVLKAAQGGK